MREFEPVFKNFRFKKDKYRSERGGQSTMIEISCTCGQPIMIYQKDGYKKQRLYRTYVNRIFYPEELEMLQYSVITTKDMPELTCPSCKQKLGTPMEHKDGRIAFGLLMGTFIRKNLPKQNRFI